MRLYDIAEFEKVSFEQFKTDWLKCTPTSKSAWTDDEIKEIYDGIEIPQRSTGDAGTGYGAEGYDFIAPIDISIPFGKALVIPTGLKCRVDEYFALHIVPRSGHGFKYGIRLANTIGVIDNDYHNTESNEGHIMIKLVNGDEYVNTDKKTFEVKKGDAFAQGLFNVFGITVNDKPKGKRKGGFGSTDNK